MHVGEVGHAAAGAEFLGAVRLGIADGHEPRAGNVFAVQEIGMFLRDPSTTDQSEAEHESPRRLQSHIQLLRQEDR
jgi:hypothetical protein